MTGRGGSVLIVVAGMNALLATLAIAFLVRMRSDVEESALVVRDAQARIMLVAACDYVLEAGRLGLGTATDHAEGYGWIDVRDGFMGPKAMAYDAAERTARDPTTYPSPRFPVGTVARFPMHVWQRTRYATSLAAALNPIRTDGGVAAMLPYLTAPDPQPAVDNGWPAAIDATRFDDGVGGATRRDYLHGDPRPTTTSTGMSWFRVKRTGPARFLLTCGAGATLGWKDYAEAEAAELSGVMPGATQAFGGDPRVFADAAANEARLWYAIEWSPAVGGATYQCIDNEQSPDHYQWRPFNPVHERYPDGHQSQPHARNFLGTIRWIQRIVEPPSDY
ncbi:MAG TPA: hypothetical protein VEL07_10305 [Planctomycetota bacterium]|nr:hypothetical protein [Planctomycetota bacterium]